MADTDYKLYGYAGVLILLAMAAGWRFNLITNDVWLYIGGIAGVGIIGYYVSKSEYYSPQKNEEEDNDELDRDFDNIWEKLQQWANRDPRDTEIVWDKMTSFFTHTRLPTSDGKTFWLMLLQCKIENTDEAVLICVERVTGYIVHYDPGAERPERKPFDKIPLVRDLRRSQHFMSSDEMRGLLRQNAVGRLPRRTPQPVDMGGSSDTESREEDGGESDE